MTLTKLPPWLRTKAPAASDQAYIRSLTYSKGLATVCREARCPNQGECAERRTATFMILGHVCSRSCSFCAVRHGTPLPVNPKEPQLVAEATRAMGLNYVVVTSVTRDDLPDGGASVFAHTVHAIRRLTDKVGVETLVPDFLGNLDAMQTVMDSGPDTIAHNLETVPRLYPIVRKGANYERSLNLLRYVSERSGIIVAKSGIMVGVGESVDEIVEVMRDLKDAGCAVLTIGQYLRPTRGHHPVDRFLTPEEFSDLERIAHGEGLARVLAGPLVRSSYKAAQMVADLRTAAEPLDE